MQTLFLFNALSQKREPFIPPHPHDVKIYCSTPTLHDVPSLAMVRPYVICDILRRLLRYHFGYSVRCVSNVTDLDDTLLAQGGLKVARHYEHQFFQTLKQLNVDRPDFAPRLTDCINLANRVKNRCLMEEYAYYKPGFDTTYFNVEAYLQKEDVLNRVDAFPPEEGTEAGKWNPRDFAIWHSSKTWTDAKGEEQCGIPEPYVGGAAMARFYFPHSIDIYLGTADLQYHEKEIALSYESWDREDWIRFAVYVQGVQESLAVDKLLNEGYSPLAIRYMFLKHPYDEMMTFDRDVMESAQKSYVQFMYYINKVKTYLLKLKPKDTEKDFDEIWMDDYGTLSDFYTLNNVKEKIDGYLKDNLNVPKALETLEDYVKLFSDPLNVNIPYEWLRYILNYVLWMADTCFGLIPKRSDSLFSTTPKFMDEVENLVLLNEVNERDRRRMFNMRMNEQISEV